MPERPHDDEREAITSAPDIDRLRHERNGGFQACLDAIPEVGAILSRSTEVGWKAVEEECCQYLLAQLGGTARQAEEHFAVAASSDQRTVFEGGSEHYILLPADDTQDNVVKWTYGNNFGLKLKIYEIDPESMSQNVIGVGNIDPRYYLKRWIILNTIGLPITKFEGLLPPDVAAGERFPRLAISQKELPLLNPSHRDIVRAFRDIGFIEIAEDAFYRPEDNVLLGDAAPRNVRIVRGQIVPFDAVAEHPGGAERAWCEKQADRHR